MSNPPRRIRSFTIACAKCGAAAAEITLLPAEQKASTLWHSRDRLERADFFDDIKAFAPWETLVDVFEAIQRQDYQTAQQIDVDPLFCGFYCAHCGVPYCRTCWGTVEWDGFALCPNGHRQQVMEP
jgi:hypothetical protein